MRTERPANGFRERYLAVLRSSRRWMNPLVRIRYWMLVVACFSFVALSLGAIATSSVAFGSVRSLSVSSIVVALVGCVVAWSLWNTRR